MSCACPSRNCSAATVHWIVVPVGQPLASSTSARKPNESPARRSLREGRISSRAGLPGALQSTLGGEGAAVTTGGATTTGAAVALGTGTGAALVAGSTADTLRSVLSRLTS